MKFPERIKLANRPTPIEKLERLSKELGGPNIYVKRDDLTGSVLSGNKVRKLEYVMKEAMDQRADIILTCGGIQSNHCRATAAIGAKLGIKVHLILAGEKPEWQGNFFLSQLFGATFELISMEAYTEHLDFIMKQVYEKHFKNGFKPYVIPTGASSGLGTFGYYGCMKEIVNQSKEMDVHFDSVVTALGSGGTLAGLFLYTKLNGIRTDVYGVSVAADEAYFRERVCAILKDAMGYLNFKRVISCNDLKIIDGYVGDGYGLSRDYERKFIKKIARQEGLMLDPVYTGKAFYGLVEEIKNGRFKKDENVLFIHTGGIFGLFAHADQFKPTQIG